MMCICPTCERQFHLSIAGSIEDWLTKFAPGIDISKEISKLECFFCFKVKEDKAGNKLI